MAEPTLSELAGWAEKLADPNAATPVGLLWQALETCAAALRRAKQEIAGLEDEIDAFRKDLQTAIAERDAALERCRVIEAALRGAFKLPRPWMQGSPPMDFAEWAEAFDKIERALAPADPSAAAQEDVTVSPPPRPA